MINRQLRLSKWDKAIACHCRFVSRRATRQRPSAWPKSQQDLTIHRNDLYSSPMANQSRIYSSKHSLWLWELSIAAAVLFSL